MKTPRLTLSREKKLALDVALSITVNAEVNVGGEQVINTNPEANASAIVLSPEDIKALPDNPAELEAALQALAGPAAGPNGGEVLALTGVLLALFITKLL